MSQSSLASAYGWIRQRASWRRVASAVVLLACLGFLGYKAYDSWEALKAYDWQIHYARLVPSFLPYLGYLFFAVWGWQSIMSRLAQGLPFLEHLKIYSLTNLMRRIPAGLVWSTLGRVYAYQRQQIPARASTVGSFLEIVLAIVSGLPLAVLAAYAFGFLAPWISVILATAALLLELAVLHPTVLGKLFSLVRHEPLRAELSYRDTLPWALIYAIVWLMGGLGLFAVARLFTDLTLQSLARVIGVWVLSSLLAFFTLLSPSGLGVRELSITFLLGLFLPDPLPLLIALAMRVIWTAYDVIAGVVAWAAH